MYDIRLSKEFNKEFVRLQNKSEAGYKEEKYIVDLISRATAVLAQDKEAGSKIPRNLWPKEYIQKYNITNLWKYKLDNYWRLIYTISNNEISFFLVYIEFLDHTEYNRRFKYKGK